ncbi:MAG: hydrogenase [Lentisphaerae bacterium]|nr:hydrogenase [Lentisphaerota bacterium]
MNTAADRHPAARPAAGGGSAEVLTTRNPVVVAYAAIPAHAPETFAAVVSSRLDGGGRLIALFGVPRPGAEHPEVLAAVAADAPGTVALARMTPAPAYPAITAVHPQAHGLERALWEEWGIKPAGHPWLKPLRRIDPEVPSPGDASFYRIDGEEIHEVAVGPVHAGIIEPGHFRFQCHGETVYHLEIRLGYQHRGVRNLLRGKPVPRWAAAAETAAGDTAVGGALAHALCIESLAGIEPSPRAQALRAVALELERIAYHVGDLGALGGDVGYLPTAQYNGRIRGDVLNLLLTLGGNRHGRGFVRPGGVRADLDAAGAKTFSERLALHHGEARRSADLLLGTPSVLARFDGTGRISRAEARTLGLVGVAARAAGVDLDTRRDHPFGAYRFKQVSVGLGQHGDVHARALVRRLEMDRAAEFCAATLHELPEGAALRPCGPLRPGHLALAMVEAWRGELVHARVTGADGEVIAAEIVDPSVHNWFGLALVLRGEEISDFPLCNKSFNLAYAGHDL